MGRVRAGSPCSCISQFSQQGQGSPWEMQPIPKVAERRDPQWSDQGSNAQALTLNLHGPCAEAFWQAVVRTEICKGAQSMMGTINVCFGDVPGIVLIIVIVSFLPPFFFLTIWQIFIEHLLCVRCVLGT